MEVYDFDEDDLDCEVNYGNDAMIYTHAYKKKNQKQVLQFGYNIGCFAFFNFDLHLYMEDICITCSKFLFNHDYVYSGIFLMVECNLIKYKGFLDFSARLVHSNVFVLGACEIIFGSSQFDCI